LAGDFTLVGDVLVLNGFQDSSATQPNTLIVERFSSESVFTLTDGTWNGVQGFGRTLSQGGTVLTVDITLGQLLISSTTPDQFDIEFGDVVSDRDIRIEGNSNSDAASFGSITQQADTEIVFSDFFSPVFSVSGAESVDLQNPRNSFGTVEIDNATSASIVTRSNLVVNGATVANQLQLTAGALDVNQASGIITTDQLFIGGDAANESSGEFSLNQANLVDELTADVSFEFNNTTNSLALTNAQDLAIVAGTFTSVFDPSVPESFDGVRVGENLQLDVTGSLQQTTGLIDIGGMTTFEATGDIELPGVDNNGNGIEDNGFEFDPQLNAGGDIVFATNGDVTAATLVAGGSVTLATSNDLTITPELVEGGGSFGFVANRITIDTDIVADQLLLQAANGVEATFGNTVDVSDLLLVGAGEFNLESGLNSIDNLATSIVGELELGNSVDLTVADLTFDSGSQDVNVSGLTVDGRLDGVTIPTTFSVARLEVTGSLFLTEQVDVLGDFSLSLRPVTAVPIEGIVGRRADLIALPEVDLNTSSLFFSVGGQVSLGDVTAPRSASIFSGDGGISLLTLQAEAGVNLQAGFFTNVGSGDLTVGSVEASDGDVFLTAVDGVNIGDVLASRELTILSEEGSIISNRVVSSNGSVEISSGANLNVQEVQAAVDVSLDAAGNNLFSGSVISGSVAELVSAGNQTALQVIAAEEAIITAEIDLRVNDIQADQVTIEAGDDIFDAQFRDGLGVQTDSLVVRAGNSNNEGTSGGIVLETDVNSLSAIVEGEGFGNIIIRELDDVVLGDIETGDGQITITAGGTISEGDIRTRVRTDQSDVRLIATGDESDIRIDEINVGNAGDVFLIADDDVVISGDGVTANSVFVRANNRSG